MMQDFLRGLAFVSRGFALLRARGLRRFVVVPIALNVVIFGGLLWLGGAYYEALLDWLLPGAAALGEGWAGEVLGALVTVLRWLLWPLFVLAGAIAMFYSFTAVANLVSAPFNGMLSARVDERRSGRMPDAVAERGLVVETLGAITDELRKIGHFALLALPLLILSLVPVVNLLAPPLWAIYGAWILALEYCDYPLGNRGLAFSEQRVLLRRRRAVHLGLGTGLLGMTLVPVLNLLAMPTGVIAATLLRGELDDAAAQPAEK